MSDARTAQKSKDAVAMSDSESEVRTPVVVGVQVQYCGACSMPLEYCEYAPAYKTACLPWRHHNLPDSLTDSTGAIRQGIDQLAIGGDDPRIAQPGKEQRKGRKHEAPKGPVHILISPLNRKNKIVTFVQNIGKVVTDEKKVAKALASRFACGASILKGPPPGIYIQGDVCDDLPEFLVEKVGLSEDQIFFFDLKKNKETPAF